MPFERVSISLRSTCRLGELQRQETFHIKDLMQHGPKHNTAYELPRVLTFRCLLKRVKNHVVNMVFEHSFRSVMMIVHHE